MITNITPEELREIPHLHRLMVRDCEKLRTLEAKAESVGSSCNAFERVQNRHNDTGFSLYLDAAKDLRANLEVRDAELKEMKARAAAWIDSLPDDTSRDMQIKIVMRYRYVMCMSWEALADMLDVQVRRVHQIDQAGMALLS